MSTHPLHPDPWSTGGIWAATSRVAALAMVLLLCGCATQSYLESGAAIPKLEKPPVVLLMKPDIQLSELTAGGLQQPHAEWTAAGLGNVEQALADMMRQRKAAMVPYEPPTDDPSRVHDDQQIIKLHRAVGLSIVQHKYFAPLLLPTKQEIFDWGLGPDVQYLRDAYHADYALFIFVRDSYATAGRVAMIVAMSLFGVGLQGGTQAGFASLVDLRTGDVVWFNRLVSTTGDLRTPEPAKKAVGQLLVGFPL